MHIAILRVSALGDVIHTIPAVALLRHYFPHAKIHWIVQDKAAALVAINPHIDKVWHLQDGYLQRKHWRSTLSTLRQLRQIKFDAIIDFQGLLKTSVVGLALRGKHFGFAGGHARERLATVFYRARCKPEYTNIIQKNLALASFVARRLDRNIRSSPTIAMLMHNFSFKINPALQPPVDALLDKFMCKPIIFSPNTTWPSKHWPLERWEEFLRRAAISIAPRCPIVLLGEKFGPQGQQLAHLIRGVHLPITIAPPLNLEQVVYLLSKTRLLIAPDTGILHIADCIGTPTLGIFGPTLALRHGPFIQTGNIARTVQIDCPHSYQKTHGNNRQDGNSTNCMAKLTAEELITIVLGELL